jgi:integrase/recombinase XerD
MSSLAPLLQAFFTDRLMTQRRASPHTIAAYRDTFRLLLSYATAQSGTAPSALEISDLDAPCITGFLTHLQQDRGNSVRTRNARLAAIHSLFTYAALRHPEHAAVVQRVLAIPTARVERNLVTYLDHAEADALLGACDQTTRTGRRDHAMFALAIQTGLRVSELIGLAVADIHLGTGPHVHCTGKGRKERRTPLLATTVAVMNVWLSERNGQPADPLFATTTGRPLSRDAVERRIRLATTRARAACPSLAGKQVTAHTLRHTAAMRLLHAGVDITVIALWLGHEQVATTNIYLHADMTIKENAIAKITPQDATAGRYQPSDPVLAFLASL